jgi:hypothetical protein
VIKILPEMADRASLGAAELELVRSYAGSR